MLSFTARVHPLKHSVITSLLTAERARRVAADSEFIQRVQSRGLLDNFANGRDVQVDAIDPQLIPCTNQSQFDLFRYCRHLQSIPAPPLLYRQIAFLVRDAGQPTAPLMGVIGLASTVYNLGCRDRLFNWQGLDKKLLKARGLQHCMQLAVCMAVPPYTYLRAARLMAALATTDAVATEFSRRYGKTARLLALVTTSATGLHCPIFNRIMIRPGGLYRRIGQTEGYSAVFFRRRTIRAATELVLTRDGNCPENRSIHTLKRALDICGIPREIVAKLSSPKAVYVASVDPNATKELRGGPRASLLEYTTLSQVVDHWKNNDVPKALSRADLKTKFRQFRREEIRL